MITKLAVANFKSLKRLEYNCSKLNVLTGLNGSGKSSLIQVLRFINAFKREFSSQSVGCVGAQVDLNCEYLSIGEYRDLVYCYSGRKKSQRTASIVATSDKNAWPVALKIEPPVGCLGNYMNSSEAMVRYLAAEKRRAKCVEESEAKCYNDMQMDPVWLMAQRELVSALNNVCIGSYLSADRGAPERVHQLFSRNYSDLGEKGNRAPSFLVQSGNAIMEEEEAWKLPPCSGPIKTVFKGRVVLVDLVNAWLSVISPGASINLRTVPELSKVIMSYQYQQGRSAPQFRPQNVGFGLSYILPMLVELLFSHEGEILVLENPEAHLHPRGQAEIGKLLAKAAANGVQLFVETHSDHIINGIRVAAKQGAISHDDVNISFFERKEHEVVDASGKRGVEIYSTVSDIKVDRNGSLSSYPDGFMDEWNNQLVELLK
ncbi:MAG: DUF3696 domain-containing protein [Kiritimatiellae bacterium]|nr:DUF3696 domain-containing protein [Kiritimatiellia bacterium]